MMKRAVHISVVLMVLFLITVLSFAQTSGLSDAVETTGSGSINWTTGEVYATGIGAPPANAVNAAQARAMADRAATVVAYRNLLETVKGVRIDSETVVENFMTKSDVIKTRVDGIVKGARIVKKQFMSDGSVEVLVAMSVKGALMDTVVPDIFGKSSSAPLSITPAPRIQEPYKPMPSTPVPEKKAEPVKPEPYRPQPQPAQPAPEKKTEPQRPAPLTQPERKAEPVQPAPAPSSQASTVQFKGGTPTGIVIDARGLGLRPALLPKVVDPQGQELYVGQVVTRTNAVEQGVAGYAKDVSAAANNFRVTDNPVVITGLRASGAVKTDVMLGQADAQALRDMGKKGDFLQYCRVIIVY